MLLTMPRRVTRMLEGSFASAMVLTNPGSQLAQVLAHRRYIDIHDALNLIVVDFRGGLQIHQLHHRIERGGSFHVGRAERNLLQINQVVNGGFAMLGILHAQEVVVAGLIVHPIIGRDHDVGIQGRDDVVDHVFLRKPQLAGVHAIDVHPDGRIVHVLRNVDLADAGKLADAASQVLRGGVGEFEIASVDLDVDGSGLPLIEDRVLHGSALKERAHVRKFSRDLVLHAIHVVEAAGFVAFVQRHLNGGGVHSGVGRVEGGDIVDDADVGEDHFEIFGSDGVPDQIFDLRHVVVGHFDPGSGGNLHVHSELARIGSRKERQAQKRIDPEAGHKTPRSRASVRAGCLRARRTQRS